MQDDTTSFDEDCERLLRDNSDRVTSVSLYFSSRHGVPQAERLGEALRGNTHVRELNLWLNRIGGGEDITVLLQFIAESATFEELCLWRAEDRSAARTGQFLHAAGGNSAITKIGLCVSSVPVEAFARMMRTTQSIEDLELYRVTFMRTSNEPDAASVDEQLAAAFASNRTLKRFNLTTSCSQLFSHEVMRSLSQHPNLQDLSIDGTLRGRDCPPHVSRALGNLFSVRENNLLKVTFRNLRWQGDAFEAIATGLQENLSVSAISLAHCEFEGPSANHLGSIFQSKHIRHSLIIQGSVSFPEENGNALANLVRSAEGLHELDLRGYNHLDHDDDKLTAIITALKESTSAVESISFGNLSPDQCESLVQCLPAFNNLQKIQFHLDMRSSHLKVRLLSAFRKNGSLTDIRVQGPFLDDSNRDLLRLVTDRNKKLPPLITSTPESSGTSIALWPRMCEASLATSQGGGPKDAFCALVGLGDRVGDYSEEEASDPPPFKKSKTG